VGTSIYARPRFWWRLVIVVCAVLGLFSAEHRVLYFTVQTNLITIGYFLVALWRMVKRGDTEEPAPRLRGGITLWLLITCLVSYVMLTHLKNPLPGLAAADPYQALINRSVFLVHYVVPIMVLVDWVAFGPHRRVRWRDTLLWIMFPLGYGVAIELRAALLPAAPIPYPYPFLDAARNGYDGVAVQFGILGVVFVLLGGLIVGLDRLAAAATDRRHRDEQPAQDPLPAGVA
jgi:hypothetical protein